MLERKDSIIPSTKTLHLADTGMKAFCVRSLSAALPVTKKIPTRRPKYRKSTKSSRAPDPHRHDFADRRCVHAIDQLLRVNLSVLVGTGGKNKLSYSMSLTTVHNSILLVHTNVSGRANNLQKHNSKHNYEAVVSKRHNKFKRALLHLDSTRLR